MNFNELDASKIEKMAANLKQEDANKVKSAMEKIDKNKLNSVISALGGTEKIASNPEKFINEIKNNPDALSMIKNLLK